MNPKISVIVPAHNEEAYIRQTLESFQGQMLHELIVVANGCIDDTANIAEDLGARVIELEKPGVSKAKNVGAMSSEGNILIFNDADTVVAPNYVESIRGAFQQGKLGYGCTRAKAENWKSGTLLYTAMLNVGGLILRESCGNMFVERDSFDQVKFDESLIKGEDTALSVGLRENGVQFGFLVGTYMIPSSRAASLKRTVNDSLSYLRFLATCELKE